LRITVDVEALLISAVGELDSVAVGVDDVEGALFLDPPARSVGEVNGVAV